MPLPLPLPAPGPEIRIEAAVDPDLRTVRGTLWRSEPLRDTALVDPLAALPDPPDDQQLFRTFPGRPSRGTVTWTPEGDGRVSFVATLPRRYGAIGATGHGLFASGGWYPQLVGLPVARWTVTLSLPPGTGGAVGNVAGDGVLTWTGDGERAGIAVVERPRYTPLDAGRSDVTLLTRGRPRRGLVRELGAQTALLPIAADGVAVEAPLRRRLVGAAPGLAYVSDRAFRLTLGFAFAHRRAVGREVGAAWASPADPFARDLAAAAMGQVQAERLHGLDADRLLGAFSWIPQIDAILSSARLPFYSEVLDRVWPGDPVHDDLDEMFAPFVPGTAVLAQLDDTYGPGTGRCVGLRVGGGDDLDPALLACGVPAGWLEPFRTAWPPEDYILRADAGSVRLTRDAPPDAPRETVVVRVDKVDRPYSLAGGETLILPGDPRSVVVDPQLHVDQTSRRGDALPPRYDWTAAAAVDTINLSQLQLYATGFLTLRRTWDTHNVFFGTLSNDRSDLVSAELGYLRKVGPLLDAYNRAYRLRFDVAASLLNPEFSETDGLALALDGDVSWTWDTRVSYDFPLRGHRLGAAVGGGGIPGTSTTWTSATVFGTAIASPHPRVALAGRAQASVAASDLDHRLLILGGEGSMRSIPALPACPPAPCFPVATERAVGALELRWAPLRGASIPLGVGWGSELQLAGGIEGMAARVDGHPAWALGATAGVLALVDVLGADTNAIGLSAGWPVAWDRLPLSYTAVPEIYLEFGQSF